MIRAALFAVAATNGCGDDDLQGRFGFLPPTAIVDSLVPFIAAEGIEAIARSLVDWQRSSAMRTRQIRIVSPATPHTGT